MWLLINSRLFNSVIVFLVLVHCLVIFAELLIDLDMVRDPFQDLNCTVTNFSSSLTVTEAINLSTNLLETRKCLSQISLTIVTIFLTEVSRIEYFELKYSKCIHKYADYFSSFCR